MIAVVDYGAGNIASVAKALEAAGARVRVASRPEQAAGAEALVVPGVGHFDATAALDETWRRATLAAIEAGLPVLGICLGMQWLFDGSDEAPARAGLGVFHGRCFRLRGDVKIPHVGWNTLDAPDTTSPLLTGLHAGASAYFTHSFAAPLTPCAIATTSHGVPFASAAARGRVFGVQFHPEKSGRAGLQILGNFIEIARKGQACWPAA